MICPYCNKNEISLEYKCCKVCFQFALLGSKTLIKFRQMKTKEIKNQKVREEILKEINILIKEEEMII